MRMVHTSFFAVVALGAAIAGDAVGAQSVQLAGEIGLSPAALASAGLDAGDAADVLSRILSDSEGIAALAAARTAADSAALAVAQLLDAAQLESSGTPPATAIDAAKTAFDTAAAALASARQQLRTAALEELDAPAVAMIDAWRLAGDRRVPDEFRAAARTEQQWMAIESALRAEGRAAREATSLDEGMATLLSEVRAESAVVAAKQALDANLDAVSAVYESAGE